MAKPDPDRYSKNANIKADSTFSLLLALVRLTLMLIGIFGISYDLYRENGWISQLLGTVFDSNINMILAVLGLLMLWWLNRWMSSPQKQDKTSVGDIPMYAMMAAGLYYSYYLYARLFTSKLLF